ncbi:hypothetical protein G7045_09875 [Acidovorax sp. HDW3]|uniref:hypothetical protein n=1 Tax=Acidovorax sp. HDW3 TaxID=2714923 RepID=UPI00140C1B13|nr:hypothetical protein [Acidovorax sp. HDW3]QIL44545.1 hypothetical protein G7045_09875 [Acidovorax sp. HDW3]
MPSRYNAPALRFCVGRSRFWATLTAMMLGLGGIGLLAWALQGGAKGAALLLAAVSLWLLCAGWALRCLRQLDAQAGGLLRWDGAQWMWAPAGGAPEQTVQLHLCRDLQWGLLLQLQQGEGVRWLWLERAMQPADWLALRRAVYSRPRLGGGAGRSAPAADSF